MYLKVLFHKKGRATWFCANVLTVWWFLIKLRKPTRRCGHLVPVPSPLSLSFHAQTLQLLPEMTSLQMLPCDPKGSADVFCFLGPPGRIHCGTGMPPREMEIPESALDTAASAHGPFPNPHSRLQLAAKFGTIMQESSLLVRHVDLSWSFLPLKNNPTFHVHSAKLYLTCNLKTKSYSSKWDQTAGHFIWQNGYF